MGIDLSRRRGPWAGRDRDRAVRGAGSTAVPVFFDPSGKRWYRVLATALPALVLAGGVGSWIAPQALDPTTTQALNQDPDYARELLATGDAENIPLLGDGSHPFPRIGLVQEVDGKTVLRDPFGDEILRTLTEEEVTAAFFAIGSDIIDNPQLFQGILDAGHLLGNHTMTHYTAADEILRNREELIGTDRIMRSVAGYASRLWRLPTGDPDDKATQVLEAQQLGHLHVDYDLDTEDWRADADTDVELPALDGAGHVVLMHDGGGDRTATVAALHELITQAKAAGYTFATVDSIVPDDYQPTSDVEAELADDATAVTVAGLTMAPDVVLGWLFWFGIGSLTRMSVLHVVLALIGHRRQSRRVWREVPEAELPLVSVILPVFDEEPVIARTLAALSASDYPHLEVVAVDDGSTDNTLEIMREFSRGWPAPRVLSQANAGKSTASNHAIMAATGEIVITLDGDTLFEPQTVRVFARHFYDPARTRPVGAVAGHVKVGNRTGILTMWQSLEYISGIRVACMAEGVVGAISIVPGACAAWRREALRQAGGYSHHTLAEDADLTMTLQKLGYAVVQENRAVAWTEAPVTVTGLAKQRLRWTYGNLQALWKHAGMLFRPRYGFLGMIALPYTMLATLIPLLFLPSTVLMAGLGLAAGDWQPIAAFALFVLAIHAVICVIAIRMVQESWAHLLLVPLDRIIYEPLRAYLLHASVLQALMGRMIGWYKPERTNTVLDVTALEDTGRRSPRS